MAINTSTTVTRSRHWLRMPAPDSGNGFELFTFTGIAVFNDLKGTGGNWERGNVRIYADYSNVIDNGKAILPKNWTVAVHLASIFNKNHSVNTGWAVDGFSLPREDNNLGGASVFVPAGYLRVDADIAIRDIDAQIYRFSYDVTILGKVVDWESGITID